jgi:hypothetical protein
LAVAGGDGNVWRVTPEDGGANKLSAGSGPAWSDDGSALAFLSDRGLITVKPDGSGQNVIAGSGYEMGKLSWSPDGKYLAASWEFTADTCGPRQWGWVIAADGSGVQELPSPYHAIWRPTAQPTPDKPLGTDPPPKHGEGCGG